MTLIKHWGLTLIGTYPHRSSISPKYINTFCHMRIAEWFRKLCVKLGQEVSAVFSTYSPRPPAPRKMPPTASASHSLETPIMMQPATMLRRAAPTRSPWYSPTLTGFIQQVETRRLALTVPGHSACLLHRQRYLHLKLPPPSCSLSIRPKHFLWWCSSSLFSMA